MITQLFVFTGIMDDTIPNLMIQACSEFGFEVFKFTTLTAHLFL